ncbi:unnamed protein product, partial [Effrenium voratum]
AFLAVTDFLLVGAVLARRLTNVAVPIASYDARLPSCEMHEVQQLCFQLTNG